MQTRLYRSPTDKVIGGVAGGLAVWMNIDPSLVRIAWVLLAIFSGGIFVLVYFVMMLVVPLPPAGWTPPPHGWTPPPGEGAMPGWDPGTGAWTASGSAGYAPGSAPPEGGPAATGWGAPPGQPPVGQPGGWTAPPPGESSRVNAENAGIVFGAVLVLLGAWFLVDEYIDIDWALLWPVVVIVLGVGLIAGAMRRGRSG